MSQLTKSEEFQLEHLSSSLITKILLRHACVRRKLKSVRNNRIDDLQGKINDLRESTDKN